MAAACPGPADPGGPVVGPVASDARRSPDAVPHGTRATAGGRAGAPGLADGVGPAWGGSSRAVSGLWAAPGVHGRHPAWGCASLHTSSGARRMTTIGFGRPVRDVVCLGAAQGQGPTACILSPRQSRRQARPSRSPTGGARPCRWPNAMGVPQRKRHSVRRERSRQAASVRGPSNKELKRHLAVGGGVSMWVSVAARRRLTPNAFGSRIPLRREGSMPLL
jgi:hypothetical protein